MSISFCKNKKGSAGLVGHIGVGHVFSHSGFVQEDGAGFAVVTKILSEAAPVNLKISRVFVTPEEDTISVVLEGGGKGSSMARCGITPSEEVLMYNAVGKDASCPQTLATTIFGRVIGQGVLEVPSAFISAVAKSVVDTFIKNYKDNFSFFLEDTPESDGCYLGTVLQIDDLEVSTILTINSSTGGIGPNEDTEGNVPIGNKGVLMRQLGMESLPTIIIEAKSYVPSWAKYINDTTLVVRANSLHDNTVVGNCLVKAAEKLGYPVFEPDTPYPRSPGSLRKATQNVAKKIVDLGNELYEAKTAKDKIRIVADLAEVIKYDVSGITFMSESVNSVVDNGGLLPGTAAVLSSAVSTEYAKKYKLPTLNQNDLKMYTDTVLEAFKILKENLINANQLLNERKTSKDTIKDIEEIALDNKISSAS